MKQRIGIFYAMLAAALYALNAPFSKMLLNEIPPRMMASLLYLGAGLGMGLLAVFQKITHTRPESKRFSAGDTPYILGMILLDIAAPIFLMLGLMHSSAANVALLNNFEIVATSLIALTLFKESISGKLWLAIALVTAASILLSLEDSASLSFSVGSLFVLLACLCWGLENNCTRKLSDKNPADVVIIKGLGSGFGALVVAKISGEGLLLSASIPLALLLGFIAYGLSIFFYIRAQSTLGAARTSAYYAIAPFIGSLLSLLLFREMPSLFFWIGLILMAAGAYLAAKE